MPIYRVKIIAKTIETYEIEADDEEEAEDNFCDGKLIATNDDIENEILEVIRV